MIESLRVEELLGLFHTLGVPPLVFPQCRPASAPYRSLHLCQRRPDAGGDVGKEKSAGETCSITVNKDARKLRSPYSEEFSTASRHVPPKIVVYYYTRSNIAVNRGSA